MPLRFLIDENMPSIYRQQLLRRQPAPVVWSVGDPGAPPTGTLDPDILLWCEAHNFLLVTNNRKSMPVHLADHLAAGQHVPGILTHRRRATVNGVLESLLLIAEAALPGEYQDRIEYLPL